MNIRTRLLLLVVAVWLPAVAAFALMAWWAHDQAEDAARAGLQQLGESLNLAIESDLARKAAVASTLAGSASLARRDLSGFGNEAQVALRARPGEAGWIAVASPNKIIFNTRTGGPVDAARPAQSPHATKATLVRFTPAGPAVSQPLVGVFAPVPRSDLNVIATTLAQEYLGILQRAELPGGGVASVIDERRVIVARSRDHELWVGRSATGKVAQMAASGENGFLRSTTLDGVSSLTYVSRPNAYGWATVVALPAASLQGAAFAVTWRLVAGSAALLGIGLLAALVLARRITAPLRTLKLAAAQVGRGQVPPRTATGLPEADAIGEVLHRSAQANHDAAQALEREVTQAVAQAREAQARLFEGQKREAIGRLTGGIAHDFNNLLQTVSVGLQLLDRSPLDAGPRRALQAAVRACGKAAELIRQMLTFGRSQSLAPRQVHLDDFVLKTLELTTKAIGPRIELSADIEPGLPPAWADATELELALLNLIFNARDAMPDGGRIRIAARRAPAESNAAAVGADVQMLCLEVSDNGCGMDEQTLARATEAFFTTKPVGSGSGLGLAQVQWFARQSGGSLVMRSAPGTGTTASICLPVAIDHQPAAEEVPVPESAPPHLPARERLHVLMVEDDVLVASVVQPALENAGHRVTLCRDASIALQRLQAGDAYDVLFTDLVMPGALDGSDLVHWCLEHRPSLPCLVVTGYATRTLHAEVGLLAKPYSVEQVLDALTDAVRKHRAEAASGG